MPSFKFFESVYNKITAPVICVLSLAILPLIVFIPSNNLLTSLAKTSIFQNLNIPVKGSWIIIEFIACCLAVFLCWSVVEIHRQRCNKFFEQLLTLANEVDLTNSLHSRDDTLLKESIKLVEQTVEDYAMLLLMLQKQSSVNTDRCLDCKHLHGIKNYAIQNSVDKEVMETQNALMVKKPNKVLL